MAIQYAKKKFILMCDFTSIAWKPQFYDVKHAIKLSASDESIYFQESLCANIAPEIGKIRPVLVVRVHRRLPICWVVPLTTKKPDKKDIAIHVPIHTLPGILYNKESWILCDLLTTVSFKRLNWVFGSSNRYVSKDETIIDDSYYDAVKKILHKMLG